MPSHMAQPVPLSIANRIEIPRSEFRGVNCGDGFIYFTFVFFGQDSEFARVRISAAGDDVVAGEQFRFHLFCQDDRHFSREVAERHPMLDYWAELATVRGRDEGMDLRGYGFDLGVTCRLPAVFSPSLSLAYAFGSCDSNTDDSDRRAHV